MLKIAIVDDEKNWREKAREQVENYFDKGDICIDMFSSGEKFLDSEDSYQIVFMDIEMPGRDGFSVLQEYREEHVDSLFIILTTHIEMGLEGYKVEAFRYIDKYHMEKIKEALCNAMLRLEKYQILEIPVLSYAVQKIRRYRVLYFEVYNHQVIMYTQTGENVRCTETLAELAERLGDKGFVLTNRSYLVNLEHIRKVEPNHVELAGKLSLPLSRRKYTDIRRMHFEWKMKRGNG